MSNYPESMKVTQAVTKNSKFSFNFQIVTSANFGILKPLLVKYCVPTDKITNCTVNEFQRLMPMPAPTFGKIDSITRAFFVPMRAIMHSFNEFISFNPYYQSSFASGTANSQALDYNVPFTTVTELNYFFARTDMSSSVTSSQPFDFAFYHTASKTLKFYKFTVRGKRIYDMLLSSGCNFPWLTADFSSSTGSQNMRNQANQKISLLPVFALYKCYIDWIVPSRYYQNYSYVQSLFRASSPFNAPLNSNSLAQLFYELRSFLENDFFTSAFENPVQQTAGQISANVQIPNPSASSSVVVGLGKKHINENTGTVVNPTVDDAAHVTTANNLNQFTLQSIGALQSMLNRGLIAGTKIQTWLETEFGIKPQNDYLDLSSYVGKFQNTISIGDVTSQSDTKTSDGGAFLGQYAGKGVGSGQAHFEYECKEHGFFIVFNEILPRTSYYQGLHPEFSMLDRFDFFQAEFDNLGMEAIPLKTLVNSSDPNLKLNGNLTVPWELSDPNKIFGFCPRYAPLKTQFDIVSGDFRIKTLNTGLDSWYLSRDFRLETGVDEDVKFISPAFCDASNGTSSNSYDRIFQFTDGFADHFYQIFYFDFNMVRPMKPVQDYMLDNQEDDKGQVRDYHTHGNDN